MAVKRGTEVATIDCTLISIKPYKPDSDELILNTANKIEVTLGTETTDAVQLIVKKRLISQKPQEVTVTGNTIVLTDNVFNAELVKILQGGTIKYAEDGTTYAGYTPPVAGSDEKGEVFELKAYSSIYGANAVLTGYECITYPNCQGVPIALSSEDGVFRVAEYTITSAPSEGEPAYDIDIVQEIPKVSGMENEGTEVI